MSKPRNFRINDLNCKVVSKAGFAKLVNRTLRMVDYWISSGIILPPSIEDTGRIKKAFGKEWTLKFYLYQEAVEVRDLILHFSRGLKQWTATADQVKQIHEAMRKWRDMVRSGDALIMDYPLLLEFRNYQDLASWIKKAGGEKEVAYQLYKLGDKKLKPRKT